LFASQLSLDNPIRPAQSQFAQEKFAAKFPVGSFNV
jgi:hypothetical protein